MPPYLSDLPIQYIKGVGPAKARLLANLNIHNVEDLLYFFPRRYEDRSAFVPILKLKPGQTQSIAGHVLAVGKRNIYSRHQPFEIAVGDQSGKIFCAWFNQPYLEKYFKVGDEIVCYGKVDVFRGRLQMVMPDFELISQEERSLNMGRIVPIYALTRGITQKYLRRLMDACLALYGGQLQDLIPRQIRERLGFRELKETIQRVHFPGDRQEHESAGQRIAFEEFFLFQVSVILRRLSVVSKKGTPVHIRDDFQRHFVSVLPFTLTAAQTRAMTDIARDMAQERPMLRLLQGDVGCGKTAVAFFACLAAVRDGYQCALMAPTEILAAQHFDNFIRLFKDAFPGIRTGLLISGMGVKEKNALLGALARQEIDIIIGTHALIEAQVCFKKLTLVIIDEQHKFGVQQRSTLCAKGQNPHVLVMTATPIPRTLCLTLYGDLEVTTIDQMPSGRGKVATYLLTMSKASGVYEKVRQSVSKGGQAYIVFPMIEESETLDLKTAKASFEHFRQHEFKDLRVDLVHGQMKRAQVDRVMAEFKNGKIDILVATTILEVGIDVPNASVMVIEHAERFGLSQLHQMRGRIGRGSKDAVCVLLADPTTPEGKARLEAMALTNDGFKIAQRDLEIRGPGHYFGSHQHGLNELKVANPQDQLHVLELARREAIELTRADPGLRDPAHVQINHAIQRRFPTYLDLVLAG